MNFKTDKMLINFSIFNIIPWTLKLKFKRILQTLNKNNLVLPRSFLTDQNPRNNQNVNTQYSSTNQAHLGQNILEWSEIKKREISIVPTQVYIFLNWFQTHALEITKRLYKVADFRFNSTCFCKFNRIPVYLNLIMHCFNTNNEI